MVNEYIERIRANHGAYHPGWGGPEYTTWQDEQMSWKTTCYIGDWSFLWDVEISGPEALDAIKSVSVNSYENFEIGQGKHIIICNEDGKVVTEGVIMRLGEQSFSTQSGTAMYLAHLIEHGSWDATWSHRPTFQFQVSGPTALAVCEKVADESLTDIRFMRFREVAIGGAKVLALRQGMAGEVGFELHGDQKDAEAVWNAVLAGGEEFGIRRLGRRTVMINHLEAAFPTGSWHYMAAPMPPEYYAWTGANFDRYGLTPRLSGSFESDDLNDYLSSPLTLGWGRVVKFDHEFVGRAALEREAAGPIRQRVTLEWDAADVIDIYASLFEDGETFTFLDIPHETRWGAWLDSVENETGELVGISTVPGYSFYFRKVLTLAYLEPEYAEPGTRVLIRWGKPGSRQKLIGATVAPAPYKTDSRRVELAGLTR